MRALLKTYRLSKTQPFIAWKLALVLHAGQWRDAAHNHRLQLATAEAACRIIDWFARGQLEILSAGGDRATRAKRDAVISLLQDQGEVTPRVLHRARIADHEEAVALLEGMTADGILNVADRETGGRPTRVFTLKHR